MNNCTLQAAHPSCTGLCIPHFLQVVEQKTTYAVRASFESLKAIFLFSFRYLGSKTWSIPGLIVRAPTVLFNYLSGRSTNPLASELFGTAHYRFDFEKTLSPEELKPYYPYACGASFAHTTNKDYLPQGWSVVSPERVDGDFPSMSLKESSFFNRDTGLKIVVLEKGNDELMVCFGAVGASNTEIPDDIDQQNILERRMKSWGCQNLLGINTPNYEEANQFIGELRKTPFFQNKKLTLVGQCYGASLASYAALKQGILAIGFNSFPLGCGVQQAIGDQALQDADCYLTHISSRYDWTTDLSGVTLADRLMSLLGIRTPGNFGHKFVIPSAYRSSCISHTFMLGSIMQHLGVDRKTLPSSELGRSLVVA